MTIFLNSYRPLIRYPQGRQAIATFNLPLTEFGTDLRRWDLSYQKRARQCGAFLACKPQFLELYNPQIITEEIMCAVFGHIPGTQNPPAISLDEFEKLKWLCGL